MLFRQIQIKQRIWPIQKLQPHIQDEPCNEPTATFSNPTNHQKSKPSGFIVGDSMIKKVVGYLLTRSLKHQYLVKNQQRKILDMCDYLKQSQRDFKPELIVFKPETYFSPKEISEDMVTLAESIKTENNKIIVSSIDCRADSFTKKVDELNAHLEGICAEKEIAITTLTKTNSKRHSNKSR